MEKLFHLKENHTDVKTEVMAGITTFMTMAYVLAVQPSAICGFGPDPYITDIAAGGRIWLINRLILLGASLLLLLGSFLLLKKDRLYHTDNR